MKLDLFNQAKKIRDKISELREYRIDLQKGCYIILLTEGSDASPKKGLSWENDLRKLMLDYIDERIRLLEKKFEDL